jgi:catechol 2,3-dioxygenase-like lactoylglutathione lyase family enzyme
MKTKFFSAVLIYSKDPERLFKFYRDILGLPLEEEKHGNSKLHYGCEIGDIHFAIHGTDDGTQPGVGSVKLAFEVFDMDEHMNTLKAHKVEITSQPRDLGFMKLASAKDPDGNTVEFTQLSKKWIEHLRKGKQKGHDLVTEWDRVNSGS